MDRDARTEFSGRNATYRRDREECHRSFDPRRCLSLASASLKPPLATPAERDSAKHRDYPVQVVSGVNHRNIEHISD